MTPDELSSVGLQYDVDGPVATVTITRPSARNAQTPQMWSTLARIGDEIPAAVRVVVVSGEGSSFSAGLDRAVLDPTNPDGVGGLLAAGDDEASAQIGEWQRAFTWLRNPQFISIAKVRGYAIGAGFQLALSCDLRITSADAKYAMKESALGLVPDLTGTKPLVEAVGYARALEICATARFVEADEALAIGLSQGVHPDAELDAAVARLAAQLVGTMEGVLPETKRLLQGAADRDLDQQRRYEREAQIRRFRAVAAAFGS